MTIKIIVNGSRGRMGQVAVTAIEAHSQLTLVASCDNGDNLSAAIQQHKPDVVIDFTQPDAAFDNTKTIIENGARPVIGTTGFTEEDIETLTALCKEKKCGGIIAPNFSLGAILTMRYARDCARYFGDVEIIETHHEKKIDAPSGTAIKTAQLISETKIPSTTAQQNETSRGEYINGIPVHAMRLPGTVADLNVIFGGYGETLSITHRSINRECFMPGLCLACEKVMELDTLVYGLETII